MVENTPSMSNDIINKVLNFKLYPTQAPMIDIGVYHFSALLSLFAPCNAAPLTRDLHALHGVYPERNFQEVVALNFATILSACRRL